ncbi:MAG: HAMP domain-containing histidine kinase [Bacteroidales bacterium]|nr:HAMP domain-containing histidine kinase [Bacteroidales bacterium]
MNLKVKFLNIYSKKQRWKLLLFLIAIVIGVSSLLYTNQLVKQLANEERKKVELWAEATQKAGDENNLDQDIGFLLKVIQNNETVPTIVVDKDDSIKFKRNLDSAKMSNEKYLHKQLEKMKEKNEPIKISLYDNEYQYIYYHDSIILLKLKYYPLIQLGVILLFILVAYFAFSASRKAEQNQVWVGLSKETAHQLGTPISSLMAWVELLKLKEKDDVLLADIEKDVNRLEKIAERFSNIGSKAKLDNQNLIKVLNKTIDYLENRISEKVKINRDYPKVPILVPLNSELFEWVVENICKNAIDAISGEGSIDISVSETRKKVHVDITDTGKGIHKSKHKTIFKPGYTTKQRGWGLGLSLAKRIIETYHDGKLYVAQSEINRGTTFRIILNKA